MPTTGNAGDLLTQCRQCTLEYQSHLNERSFMRKWTYAKCAFAPIMLLVAQISLAENPIVQTNFTADPAPMVYNDTFYVYCGHDETNVNSVWFNMKEWRCYSSVDMANWTDRGSPMNLTPFSWANADAWAAQCIPRNGKFYLYAPVYNTTSKNRMIGVGVATSPTGPFTDAIGHSLLSRYDCCYIDPTAYIDTDGQAYLYFGNPYCYWVKMNADMISYSGDTTRIPENATTFSNCYGEAPWLYKRNGLYYLIWAADNSNGKENIRYSTSAGPTGPWQYKGIIMPTEGANWVKPCTSWTNHEGIVDYKGNSYFVYHNAGLPNSGTSGFTRSVCIEQFTYNADGTIPLIHMTLTGTPQIGTLNPYDTTQAETICWESGVRTQVCSEGGMNVDSIHNEDYIKVKGVNFVSGANLFMARVSSNTTGGSIELRLDTITGPVIGTCTVAGTGGWQTWATRTCTVTGATGVHNLYFKFTGGSGLLFNFNWWKFNPVPTGINETRLQGLENGRAIKMSIVDGETQTLRVDFTQMLSHNTNVRVCLFDLTGRLVTTLFNGPVSSSCLSIPFGVMKIRSGVCFVNVSINNKTVSTKTITLK
jgi:arabinoxylan arabinofuranohydrolase